MAQTKELSPAQVVALRFPAAWSNGPVARTQGATTVAKRQTPSLFDPKPTYSLASADSRPALPKDTLAYADTGPAPKQTTERAVTRQPETKVAERHPVTRPAPKHNNSMLNDAQIASIKARLKLTPQQEYYWPSVEQALRGIAYKMNKGKMATIDANSPEVEQLKSAAIPLLMMFNDDQRNEVRQLANLMGLQKLAAQI